MRPALASHTGTNLMGSPGAARPRRGMYPNRGWQVKTKTWKWNRLRWNWIENDLGKPGRHHRGCLSLRRRQEGPGR